MKRIILLFSLLGVLSCADKNNKESFSNDIYSDFITISTISPNENLPVVFQTIGETDRLNTDLKLAIEGATIAETNINVKMGCGAQNISVNPYSNVRLVNNYFSYEKEIRYIENPEVKQISGTLSKENAIWDSTYIIEIVDDLYVPEDITLEINEGTKIKISENANLIILGKLDAIGTKDKPILFTSKNVNEFWGGIIADNSVLNISYSFFTYGGADRSHGFGHSSSQPLIKAVSSILNIENCYLFDNLGKGFGTDDCIVNISKSLISRCDTGGEFHYSITKINDTFVSDLPMPGEYIDDNDGFYFYRPYKDSDERSYIKNSILVDGFDDAIDHNGAHLDIVDCYLAGFKHEGLAASYYNKVRIINSVVKDCGQGIEAGKGYPDVEVNHCVIIDNEVGLRFGDEYQTTSTGLLNVENSIIYNNTKDTYNYVDHTGESYQEGISVEFSIINDSEFTGLSNCFYAEPIFGSNYYLEKKSPGINKANDGKNLGRIND